jgi:hypothetical protein
LPYSVYKFRFLVIPRRGIFIEELLVTQLIKNLPVFYNSWSQCRPSYLIGFKNLNDSSLLCLCLPSGPFSSGFQNNILYDTIISLLDIIHRPVFI